MNPTLDLLRKRRSLRANQLIEPGPDRETLAQLLTLAARVPDHGKLAPWRFIVVANDARRTLGQAVEALAIADQRATDAEAREVERQRFLRAPVVVALVSRARPHPKIPIWEQQLSAGAVAMNLLIACEATGFSATWITEWYAFDRRMMDELGLAPDEVLAGFIHIGTPSIPLDERTDRTRPVMADIISHYGE